MTLATSMVTHMLNMQSANWALMPGMHSADVALTYARGYAAPTIGCLTAVVP